MELKFSPAEERFRAEARAWLEANMPRTPRPRDLRARREYDLAWQRKMHDAGWAGIAWPREFGGRGATVMEQLLWYEEYARAGAPDVSTMFVGLNHAGPTLVACGSEEQKAFHLPKISAGNMLWCQGFSEPEAGSDLVSLRTAAARSGDDYVVNGSKIWTSYVAGAEYCFLLVRTDPNSKRHRGISVLLAPMDAPGITVREVPAVIGERYFHELFFDDARIPASCRLGPEGEGWGVVSYALAFERVGAMRYARAALTLDALAEAARERGRLDDPVIQEKLGAARTAVEASRLLSYRVIDLRAKGSEPTADTNIARVAGTLCENAVSDLALEIYGAEALAYGNFAESYWRLAMTAGVAVGTTEINLNLIASRWLDLPRE